MTTEISRITRSTKQLCDIIELIKTQQLKLVIKNSIIIDCTAGKDIDPMTKAFLQMAGVFAGSPLINFTTILLIVVSGLGFPVWYDILGNIKKAVRERGTRPLKWLFTRLELQSKVFLPKQFF